MLEITSGWKSIPRTARSKCWERSMWQGKFAIISLSRKKMLKKTFIQLKRRKRETRKTLRQTYRYSAPILSFFLSKIIPDGRGIMYVVRYGSELVAIPMRKLSAAMWASYLDGFLSSRLSYILWLLLREEEKARGKEGHVRAHLPKDGITKMHVSRRTWQRRRTGTGEMWKDFPIEKICNVLSFGTMRWEGASTCHVSKITSAVL